MRKPTPTTTKGNLARQDYGAPIAASPYHAAMDYLARGWPVIPLLGNEYGKDYQHGKRPAIKAWEKGTATQDDVTAWFAEGRYSAMGIVLGAPSHLAVLDFDDLEKLAAFRQQLPDLADTYEVRTGSQGAHFYYALPDDLLNVCTTTLKGIGEFRANGAQVVAAGTEIDGAQWILVNDREPRTLNKHNHAAILKFMGMHSETESDDSAAPLVMLPTPTNAPALVAVYRKRCETKPRNYSLYLTALDARNAGMSAADAAAALTAAHVNQPAPPGHDPETARARAMEAQRTIASAYKANYRAATGTFEAAPVGLPNGLREHLLKQKPAKGEPNPASFARVMDLLLMTGVKPGDTFTERDAIASGKTWGIGHVTIRTALKQLSKIQPTITLLRSGAVVADAPSASLSTHLEAGGFVSDGYPNTGAQGINALLRSQSDTKVKKANGRPTKSYVMPTPDELCIALGVTISPGDKLELTDLRSTKAYRAGMQRALVERKPGIKMTRQWQAERLGVSLRHVHKLDKLAGIQAKANEDKKVITFANVDQFDFVRDGVALDYKSFIRINDHENKPPRKGVAIHNLMQGHKVEFVTRLASSYTLAEQPNPLEELGTALGAVIVKGDSHE